MPMHFVDWLLVALPLLVILGVGFRARSYIKSVSGFLSAGRCAGRYLLSVADGSAGLGLITMVGMFEMYYRTGNSIGFWSGIGILVGLVMTMTGFVTYRYRETRAMTLAQFFEMRYSRSFRVFAGLLSFLSGILNYALFPAIGGRFFLYYCGFPETFRLLGIEFSTFGTLMALFLGVALVIVMTGGQLTTMITDCLQGIYSYFAYALLVGVILYTFSFSAVQGGDARAARGVLLPKPLRHRHDDRLQHLLRADRNLLHHLLPHGVAGQSGVQLLRSLAPRAEDGRRARRLAQRLPDRCAAAAGVRRLRLYEPRRFRFAGGGGQCRAVADPVRLRADHRNHPRIR